MPQTSTSRHPTRPAQQATTGPPTSIPDASLGLSREDVAALRQHQQLAHQHAQSSRGSNASSQGRLLLDPASLTLLGRHLERVMQAIQQRLEAVRDRCAHMHSLLTYAAQSRNRNRYTNAIRQGRQRDRDGRCRNSTLQAYTTADRRPRDRV